MIGHAEAISLFALKQQTGLLSVMPFLSFLLSSVIGAAGASHSLVDETASETVVVDFTHAGCGDAFKVDGGIHAYRDISGDIVMPVASEENRRIVGASFNSLKPQCSVTYEGAHGWLQSALSDRDWLHATYTDDGVHVFALVHEEYWGHLRYPQCLGQYASCWWNSVTWVSSGDGGKTFVRPSEGRREVIGLAYDYEPAVGRPVGFMNPSSVLRVGDALYAFAHAMGYGKQPTGNYLIRTSLNDSWYDWKVWKGNGFFSEPKERSGGQVGVPVDVGMFDDLRAEGYNAAATVYGLYRVKGKDVYVALFTRSSRGKTVDERAGFYVSYSRDLLKWTLPVQIARRNYRGAYNCGAMGPQVTYRYAGLIDERSVDRNFAEVGANVWLYTERYNVDTCGKGGTSEALVKIPIKLKVPAELR